MAARPDAVDARVLALLLGDCTVIVAVLSLGIVRHHGVTGLLDVGGVLETVLPFLVGWLLAAPLVGAYGGGIDGRHRRSVGLAVAAWMGATVVGAGIRATAVVSGGATPVFVVVVAGTGGLGVALWRLVVAELANRDRWPVPKTGF